MAWIAGIGAAVAGIFTAGAVSSLASMVVGGLIVGAAVGGLYSAITGGDILDGVLYGALGGAVLGAGGAALGFGSGTLGSVAGGEIAAGAIPVGIEGSAYGAAAVTELSTSGGILGGVGAGIKSAGSALFTSEGFGAIGAVSSLGSAFLKGGMESDSIDKQIASSERMQSEKLDAEREMAAAANETALAQAEMAAESAAANRESQEKLATAELDFSKDKFSKEFGEDQWRDREDRREKKEAKERFEEGLQEASEYVAGNTQVANLVDSSRRRKELPSPAWYERPAPTTEPPAQPQPAATGMLTQGVA